MQTNWDHIVSVKPLTVGKQRSPCLIFWNSWASRCMLSFTRQKWNIVSLMNTDALESHSKVYCILILNH